MLFVYLLVLILYTDGISAPNTTVPPEFCAKPGCPDCVEISKVCYGKDDGPICALKRNLIDPEAPGCNFIGCPAGEAKIQITVTNISCAPINRLVNGSLGTFWMWEHCTKQKEIDCGTWTPLCVSSGALLDYNITKGGCIAKGCGPEKPGMHPCTVEGGVECIPYDDLKTINSTWLGHQCTRATPEDKAAAAAAIAAADEKPQSQVKASPAVRSRITDITTFAILATQLIINTY